MEQIPATGNRKRKRWRVFQRPLDNLNCKIDEVAPIAVRAGQRANIMARSQ
jgi:hypothetical protein